MRARNIKPGFFRNEQLGECSFGARLLFIGLWCAADRNGRLEDRRKRLKADIFPFDDPDMDKLIDELVEHGFIGKYEVEGHNYLLVMNFAKHQSPHHTEKGGDIPPPHGEITVGSPLDHGEVTVTSRPRNDVFPSDSLIPDSLIPDYPRSKQQDKRPRIGWTECDGFLNVSPKHREEWSGAFPAVNLDRAMKQAHVWLVANPKKRKKNYEAFLANWFRTNQEKGGDVPSVRAARNGFVAPPGGLPPPLAKDYQSTPGSTLTVEEKRALRQQAESEMRV